MLARGRLEPWATSPAAARDGGLSMLPHGFAEDVRLHFRHHEQRRRGRDVFEILGDLRGVDCVPDLLSSE